MCILMVMHQGVQGYPIVLAANRDEYYDRPTHGPGLLARTPAIWGGQDQRAGGTWLGVNAYGLVVGLTNRRLSQEQVNDPQRRSRGLVCLEALHWRTAAEAVDHLTRQPAQVYNPFNLLVMDRQELLWIAYDESLRTQRLQPGLHILANGNINDFTTVRLRRARHLLQSPAPIDLDTLLPLLQQVCRDHEVGVGNRETICMHRESDNYGTVSSTILAVPAHGSGYVYRYASGAPCVTPYDDYTVCLRPQIMD